MPEITEKLDARGMNCPLPILNTSKALKQINKGEILEVTASDPGSVKDIAAYCEQSGNRLLSSKETAENYVFLIEKV